MAYERRCLRDQAHTRVCVDHVCAHYEVEPGHVEWRVCDRLLLAHVITSEHVDLRPVLVVVLDLWSTKKVKAVESEKRHDDAEVLQVGKSELG